MRLELAMLADAVTALEGKLYIQGGGVRRLSVAGLPAPWAGGMAVRLLADRAEIGTNHTFRFRTIPPNEEQETVESEPLPFSVAEVDSEDETVVIQIAIGLMLGFSQPGLYQFELLIDDELVATLPLRVAVDERLVAPVVEISTDTDRLG